MTVSSSMSTPPRSGPSIPPPPVPSLPSHIPIVPAPPIKIPAPVSVSIEMSDEEDNGDDKINDPEPITDLNFPDFTEEIKKVWFESHMKFNKGLLSDLEKERNTLKHPKL